MRLFTTGCWGELLESSLRVTVTVASFKDHDFSACWFSPTEYGSPIFQNVGSIWVQGGLG